MRRIDGLEARAHFDPDTSLHQHVICDVCKKVWDIAPGFAPPDLPDGFTAKNIMIQGICEDCSQMEE